jgi:choline dehydrogenase-like flavoprotein
MAVLDLHSATGSEFQAADVCVVGAGAAGISLAVELDRLGKRVLVLEGGGAQLEPSSQALYQAESIGHPHAGARIGRFRTYGGTTTKWAGQLLEFDPSSFARRPWIAGSGWPISKRDLAPYYARALELEGMTGVERDDSQVWEALGHRQPKLSPDLESYFTRWIRERDFTKLHGPRIERTSRVMVYLHANATDLVLDPDGRRVTGIRCRTLNGTEHEFVAGSFVLCLGGIETVRFLLQPHRNPWSKHPMLGRHFQDHPLAVSGVIAVKDDRLFQRYFANAWVNGWKYHPRFRPTLDVKRRESLLDSTVAPFAPEDERTLRIKELARSLLSRRGRIGLRPRGLRDFMLELPALSRYGWHLKRHGRIYMDPEAPPVLGVQCEQEPLGQSCLKLTSDRDALGMLRVAVDWRVSELELRTLARCTEITCAALAARGIATVTPHAKLGAENAAFAEQCHDVSHHMGGARMAQAPTEGVVDPNLRLWGTENAYVCSAAVFPTSGTSNPTHTIIALAIRLADELGSKAPAHGG